jgi:hypothetical protein
MNIPRVDNGVAAIMAEDDARTRVQATRAGGRYPVVGARGADGQPSVTYRTPTYGERTNSVPPDVMGGFASLSMPPAGAAMDPGSVRAPKNFFPPRAAPAAPEPPPQAEITHRIPAPGGGFSTVKHSAPLSGLSGVLDPAWGKFYAGMVQQGGTNSYGGRNAAAALTRSDAALMNEDRSQQSADRLAAQREMQRDAAGRPISFGGGAGAMLDEGGKWAYSQPTRTTVAPTTDDVFVGGKLARAAVPPTLTPGTFPGTKQPYVANQRGQIVAGKAPQEDAQIAFADIPGGGQIAYNTKNGQMKVIDEQNPLPLENGPDGKPLPVVSLGNGYAKVMNKAGTGYVIQKEAAGKAAGGFMAMAGAAAAPAATPAAAAAPTAQPAAARATPKAMLKQSDFQTQFDTAHGRAPTETELQRAQGQYWN